MTVNVASIAPERARRVASTPYARRLARERGIALAAVTGTGPNGRITGDDIIAFVPPAAVAATSAAPAFGALAVSVDLAASRGLLDQFPDLDPPIAIIDIVLKAAAAAFRSTPDFADGDRILLLGERRTDPPRALNGLGRLTLSAIAALRAEEGRAQPEGDGAAGLAISWLAREGIRPVAMPLTPGAPARLVVGAGPATTEAECLLSYDPERIDDSAAADFLLAFKTAMEVPLRLIA